jgi:UDP-N-acetylglucosamine transferase subunit ALG13
LLDRLPLKKSLAVFTSLQNFQKNKRNVDQTELDSATYQTYFTQIQPSYTLLAGTQLQWNESATPITTHNLPSMEHNLAQLVG